MRLCASSLALEALLEKQKGSRGCLLVLLQLMP
jgi:hypothetical protein